MAFSSDLMTTEPHKTKKKRKEKRKKQINQEWKKRSRIAI